MINANIELNVIYELISELLPFEILQMRFLQRAFLGLLLLAPQTALMGTYVVNFHFAFFSDAISHCIFTGIALGIILSINVKLTVYVFSILLAVLILFVRRRSGLSSDVSIGVFFSGTVAFGLAFVSRQKELSRDIQRFLYGDLFSLEDRDLIFMIFLLGAVIIFQSVCYNKLVYTGFSPLLAKVHGIKVAFYEYLYVILLSVLVVFSVWAVGVLLVTAMLILPGATAKNLARSGKGMVWYSIVLSFVSAIAGFFISIQDWAGTAVGPTIVLVAFLLFFMSMIFTWFTEKRPIPTGSSHVL